MIRKQDLRDLKQIQRACLSDDCLYKKSCMDCRWGVKRTEEDVCICIGVVIGDVVRDIESYIKEDLFKEYMEVDDDNV